MEYSKEDLMEAKKQKSGHPEAARPFGATSPRRSQRPVAHSAADLCDLAAWCKPPAEVLMLAAKKSELPD